MVSMQNSSGVNMVNQAVSLLNDNVYAIPTEFIIDGMGSCVFVMSRSIFAENCLKSMILTSKGISMIS